MLKKIVSLNLSDAIRSDKLTFALNYSNRVVVNEVDSQEKMNQLRETFVTKKNGSSNVILLNSLDPILLRSKQSKLTETEEGDFSLKGKKLHRVLSEGGVVIVNCNLISSQDLLFFNSIDGKNKSLKVGHKTYTVHPNTKFIFAGSDDVTQKFGADFMSRSVFGGQFNDKADEMLIINIQKVETEFDEVPVINMTGMSHWKEIKPKVGIQSDLSFYTIKEDFPQMGSDTVIVKNGSRF